MRKKKTVLLILSGIPLAVILGLLCFFLMQDTDPKPAVSDAGEAFVEELTQPQPDLPKTNAAPTQEAPAASEEEPSSPEEEPEQSDAPETITLMAVGDNLIHKPLIRSGIMSDGSYNYDAFYRGITLPLSQADIKIINQETILGGNYLGLDGYPRFNSPTELGDSVIQSGFNVVLQASNHAADMGYEGLSNCVDYWKSHPEVLMVGINNDETIHDRLEKDDSGELKAPADIPIFTIKDHTFAILNYTYSPNMSVIPKNIQWHLNILCQWNKNTGAISFTKLNPQVLEDIRTAKELADVVIVFPHWGIEYQTKPSVYQKEWAQQMADAGADLIIGTHPHVCQPVEWLTAEDGSSCLCYYSLGNYVSTQRDPISMFEGLAWVTFKETENGLEIAPESTGVFSLVNQYRYNPVKFENVYFLEDYTPALAKKHGIPLWGNGPLYVEDLKKWESEIFGDMALSKEDVFSETAILGSSLHLPVADDKLLP